MRIACFWPVPILLAAVACSHHELTPETPAPAAQSQSPRDSPGATRNHGDPVGQPMISVMADHFVSAMWARDCIIAGDLASAREPLQALAAYVYPADAAARWPQALSALQATARATAQATTLEAGAAGVSELARICGQCHEATGGGPASLIVRPEHFSEYPEDSFTGRMYRHLWGAERLWQGLVAPSERAWLAGAEAIGEAPSQMEHELPARFGAALLKIRELSALARVPHTIAQRSELYGQLLATCATCHERSQAAALRGH